MKIEFKYKLLDTIIFNKITTNKTNIKISGTIMFYTLDNEDNVSYIIKYFNESIKDYDFITINEKDIYCKVL